MTDSSIIQAVAAIVVALIEKDQVTHKNIGETISTIHDSLITNKFKPTNKNPDPVSNSYTSKYPNVTHDHIISFVTGRKFKILKHALNEAGMTREQYLHKYDLPSDYPKSSPAFEEWARQNMRKQSVNLNKSRWKRKKTA